MRKFFKAFFLSLGLLVLSAGSVNPQLIDLNIPNKVLHSPETVFQLITKYHVSMKEAEKITDYPILFPLNKEHTKRISSRFGLRKHPVYGHMSFHNGIDISSEIGNSVMATANGVVISTKNTKGYGKQVLVAHKNGYITRYAHLSEVLVKKGDTVNALDTIGKIGNTGCSTGPHLHYEVIFKGLPIDPISMYSDTLNDKDYLSQSFETNDYFSGYSDDV